MSEGIGVAGIGAGMVSVSRSQLEAIHRDLDACQKVIWLAGGFDPAYCQDAQARLKEIAAILAQPVSDGRSEQQPTIWATHPKGAAVDADCGFVGEEEAKNYAPGCVTPLYAAPIAQAAPQPEPLPYWEPCNPGCDPEFNGQRSRHCASLCHAARAALSDQGGGQ